MTDSKTARRSKPISGYAAEIIDGSPYVKTEVFAAAAKEMYVTQLRGTTPLSCASYWRNTTTLSCRRLIRQSATVTRTRIRCCERRSETIIPNGPARVNPSPSPIRRNARYDAT